MRIQSSISGQSIHSNVPNYHLPNQPTPYNQSMMDSIGGNQTSMQGSPLGQRIVDADENLDAVDFDEKSGDQANNKRVQFKVINTLDLAQTGVGQ